MDLRKTHTLAALVRDITLSIAIGLLLPFVAYLLARVIKPTVAYDDIQCEYKGVNCKDLEKQRREADEELRELKITQKIVSTQQPAQSIEIDKEVNALESKLATLRNNIEVARESRNTTYKRVNEVPLKTHLYIAIIIALFAFLGAFFIPVLPLEIGFIMGGTLTLLTGLMQSWASLSDLLKLIGLLLGLIALIGIGVKVYLKKEHVTE